MPDRLPAGRRWSRKHADTQRRLCERFVAPVIGAVTCQDIRVADMQKAVNAAPTAGEGERLHRCLSAMVTAGITGGYLASPRLREVHWQAGAPAPGPQVSMPGSPRSSSTPPRSPPAPMSPGSARPWPRGRRGDLHELMANTAAYTGLRQGELFALTIDQVTPAAASSPWTARLSRSAGSSTGLPKGRKRRNTIYPVRTPQGYPLADKIAARIEQARAELEAGTNPLGLMFPSPRGGYWRSSNFDRRVLAPAYQAAGWRDADGNGTWTWHSLRHVFCTAALFTWHLEATDVSCHGRARQRPHHPRHVRRHHRRRPRPRPHRHRITSERTEACPI